MLFTFMKLKDTSNNVYIKFSYIEEYNNAKRMKNKKKCASCLEHYKYKSINVETFYITILPVLTSPYNFENNQGITKLPYFMYNSYNYYQDFNFIKLIHYSLHALYE